MISATALNAQNSLNKGPQIPLGLDNGRLRVDSQKFLVPSLPVSARVASSHHDAKRRERSIVNGTANPQVAVEPHFSSQNPYSTHVINGLRSYGPAGSREIPGPSSPHSNPPSPRSSPHHPFIHMNSSPRKDAHSPMYVGDAGPLPRSSMPIPCSSPAQASSASPKGSSSHSLSPSGGSGGNYSPKMTSGPPMLPPPPAAAPADLNGLTPSRLYAGFPPPHPSMAAHLTPAFYAAAAAAAASHPLSYPMFGTPYSHHPHSAAAATAYLDQFHSALVHRGVGGTQEMQRSRSPSPSPPIRAYHVTPQQSHNSHLASNSHSHGKLNEAGERIAYNGVNLGQNVPGGQFSPPSGGTIGLSKGGPLGISGGIMNLPSSSLSGAPSPQKQICHQPENLVVHKSPPKHINGYHHHGVPKHWVEHSQTVEMHERRAEVAELRPNRDFRVKQFSDEPLVAQPSKAMKPSSHPSDTFSSSSLRKSIDLAHQHQVNNASSHGVLTDSNARKSQSNNHVVLSQNHKQQHFPQQPSHFLPPSPKHKRSSNSWVFAVPANPTQKTDSQLSSNAEKYLNSNSHIQNLKPSNQLNSMPTSVQPANADVGHQKYLSPGQSAQSHSLNQRNNSSSGPSTPKSPSVHQVKFSFTSGNSKENLHSLRNQEKSVKSARKDSSSSSSSNEGNVPWPVEQMPILEAFRRGSLIKLATGDLKPVEELRAEDFIHAVSTVSESLKIIHCTVLSIENEGKDSRCRVTMTVGSQLQNQQVVVPSKPEQPFFVLGRGWSSLSPSSTEKLLQLPCSPLSVGDVCITVSKTSSTPKAQGVKGNVNKTRGQGHSAPKTRTANNSNSTGSACNANVANKRIPPSSPSASNSSAKVSIGLAQIQSIYSTEKSDGLRKRSAGSAFTVTTSATSTIPTASVAQSDDKLNQDAKVKATAISELNEHGDAVSPKKRRWSAPEAEVGDKVSSASEVGGSGSKAGSPSPSSLELKKEEPLVDKMRTDENCNVNIDVANKELDAQATKN